jgi:hypothetical protein
MPFVRKKSKKVPDLIGNWRSTESADEMEFFSNGELHFRTPTDEGTVGIMLLTYRVDGDVIITDQPSMRAEERTRFVLAGGTLLLTAPDGSESTWVRG